MCAEGICGCDVQLNAEFRAEMKASPHPNVLPCVMPALKSSQRWLCSGCGEGTWGLHPRSSGTAALAALWNKGQRVHAHHPIPACVPCFRAASSAVQAGWKEPLFPPRQSLSLWRELERWLWIYSELWQSLCLPAPRLRTVLP